MDRCVLGLRAPIYDSFIQLKQVVLRLYVVILLSSQNVGYSSGNKTGHSKAHNMVISM